jgi:hypothetical protein
MPSDPSGFDQTASHMLAKEAASPASSASMPATVTVGTKSFDRLTSRTPTVARRPCVVSNNLSIGSIDLFDSSGDFK